MSWNLWIFTIIRSGKHYITLSVLILVWTIVMSYTMVKVTRYRWKNCTACAFIIVHISYGIWRKYVWRKWKGNEEDWWINKIKYTRNGIAEMAWAKGTHNLLGHPLPRTFHGDCLSFFHSPWFNYRPRCSYLKTLKSTTMSTTSVLNH